MSSIKVKRKTIWDAWQLTTDSFQEIVDVLNAETGITDVQTSIDSVSFKHYQTTKTLQLNDWIIKSELAILFVTNSIFSEKWEQV